MRTNIPTLTGYPNTYANIGKTKNHGVEIALNAVPVQTRSGFTWETSLNAAYQKDEIVELAYGKTIWFQILGLLANLLVYIMATKMMDYGKILQKIMLKWKNGMPMDIILLQAM